jgi:hypothetical protein
MKNTLKEFAKGYVIGWCGAAGIMLLAATVYAVATGQHLEWKENE